MFQIGNKAIINGTLFDQCIIMEPKDRILREKLVGRTVRVVGHRVKRMKGETLIVDCDGEWYRMFERNLTSNEEWEREEQYG